MVDLFNNCDLLLSNATKTDKGLVPDKDKVGQIILKPKEDTWIMANHIKTDNITYSNHGIFQASIYDNYPTSIGLGYWINNELHKIMYMERDLDNSLFFMCDVDENKVRTPILGSEYTIHKLNTIALHYSNGYYFGNVNNFRHNGFPEKIICEVPPVFFVEFDSTLRAVVLGSGEHNNLYSKIKVDTTYMQEVGEVSRPLIEKVTERPNFFIKDKND